MAFLATFKQRFFRLRSLFLAMLLLVAPLVWLSISRPKHIQYVSDILSQNAYLFSALRWSLILAFFIIFKPMIDHVSTRFNWSLVKIQFWQAQRLKIIIWLILFELVLCENLLLTLFHLIARI